ncbi:MarR family transcriptional regulator [Nakamurella sp. YIM 132087]|uniref:MarR family transcriptional regulator n=1 Tax=Nakamurella alba TaxID=2665158 RepID=A0A7K1FEW9_9ACTN|nr:MarR family winged helix-turn-helix transcriptional regulator [Nakamurella alba]MTD12655.1 MarR family transcriptional regulator [Nakamurella alba]
MDPLEAPARTRDLPSFLLTRNALTARQLLAARLDARSMRHAHFSTLAAIDEFGPLSQAELGRRIGLDRSDVTAVIADLEARGLLDRSPDPADRRRNLVLVNARGRTELETLEQIVQQVQDDFLAPLAPDERTQLHRLLRKLAGVPTVDPAGD